MKYVPLIFGLEGELEAIKNQNFGPSVAPFIQIVKDIKKTGGKASVLDDIENAVTLKPNNIFFLTIPKNYDLTMKLKTTVERFFTEYTTNPKYGIQVMNRFSKYNNVIPVIEVNYSSYRYGDLNSLKSMIASSSGAYAYRVNIDNLSAIESELSSLVTSKDTIIYDLESDFLFFQGRTRIEVTKLESIKAKTNCELVVIKQIYNDLTFKKMPNRKIKTGDEAFNCIDFNFISDFKSSKFDHFGDWAGIRNIPLYDGGMSYPSYLTVELDSFDHHGFKGIEQDNSSFKTTLLPKYTASPHWNTVLVPSYKATCYTCNYVNSFMAGTEKPNSATKWKTMTVGHFCKATDHKIRTGRI